MCKNRVGPQVYIYSPQKITFIILYPSLPLYYHFPLKTHGKGLQKGFETNGQVPHVQSKVHSKGSGDRTIRKCLREEGALIMQEINLTQKTWALLKIQSGCQGGLRYPRHQVMTLPSRVTWIPSLLKWVLLVQRLGARMVSRDWWTVARDGNRSGWQCCDQRCGSRSGVSRWHQRLKFCCSQTWTEDASRPWEGNNTYCFFQ